MRICCDSQNIDVMKGVVTDLHKFYFLTYDRRDEKQNEEGIYEEGIYEAYRLIMEFDLKRE